MTIDQRSGLTIDTRRMVNFALQVNSASQVNFHTELKLTIDPQEFTIDK